MTLNAASVAVVYWCEMNRSPFLLKLHLCPLVCCHHLSCFLICSLRSQNVSLPNAVKLTVHLVINLTNYIVYSSYPIQIISALINHSTASSESFLYESKPGLDSRIKDRIFNFQNGVAANLSMIIIVWLFRSMPPPFNLCYLRITH